MKKNVKNDVEKCIACSIMALAGIGLMLVGMFVQSNVIGAIMLLTASTIIGFSIDYYSNKG